MRREGRKTSLRPASCRIAFAYSCHTQERIQRNFLRRGALLRNVVTEGAIILVSTMKSRPLGAIKRRESVSNRGYSLSLHVQKPCTHAHNRTRTGIERLVTADRKQTGSNKELRSFHLLYSIFHLLYFSISQSQSLLLAAAAFFTFPG